MKKGRFTPEQIIGVLKRHESPAACHSDSGSARIVHPRSHK